MVRSGAGRQFGLNSVIETAIDFSIGFLSAALLGLLLVPLIFRHVLHRSVQRVVAATPYPPAEIRADRDQLRGRLAMSTRQLEMSLTEMKSKTMSKLAELGEKTNLIGQLKSEIGEQTDTIRRLRGEIEVKCAAIVALEDRSRTLGERLRTVEEQFEIRGQTLRHREEVLADKEAELVKLVGELGERTTMADQQREEIDGLREQVDAIRLSVADYELALNETVLRLASDDDIDASWANRTAARDERNGLGARRQRS